MRPILHPRVSCLLRAALACLALLGTVASARPLSPDEWALFVPNTARALDAQRIEVRVDAWVYEIERRPGVTHAFADHLGLDLDSMESLERERFYARTQLFRVDSEGHKDLILRFDAQTTHALPTTALDGRTHARFVIEGESSTSQAAPLHFALDLPPGDPRRIEGYVLRVPEQGLSVVSDIDDTIKHSQVRDRRELLLNTFAREFLAVPEMAARYRALATHSPGVAFHYVSAGPIQLYPALAPFLREAGFPEGSVHLRESTTITTVIPAPSASVTHKLAAIGTLLRDFPQRRFLLIGDSGENDPEIYARIAREHPDRIVRIHIRDVTDEPASAARYRTAFADLPPTLWSIFTDPPDFAPPQ